MEQNQNVGSKKQEKPIGSIIGIIIIVLIIILAGFYILGNKTTNESDSGGLPQNPTIEDIAGTPDAAREALTNTSTSDDINAIESDINATDLSGLDAELGSMEAELNTTLPQ